MSPSANSHTFLVLSNSSFMAPAPAASRPSTTAPSEVVGWHVAKKGDRWATLEPIRQGVRAHMGGFRKAIGLGLGLKHDWGPQYRPSQFQAEIKCLGIRSTPAYVGEPECNGVAERFIRTLKEECIHLHDFETLEEARAVIGAFIHRYNNGGSCSGTGT